MLIVKAIRNSRRTGERRCSSFWYLLLLLFLFLVLASCNEHPPEIPEVYYQINLVRDEVKGKYYETLSLFAHIIDEDGDDDIVELYCIFDEAELFWRITEENWVLHQQQDELWIGSNSLVFPRRTHVPRGQIRVVAVDKAGERSEYSFYINAPLLREEEVDFPSINKKEGGPVFSVPQERGELRFYGKDSSFVFLEETSSFGQQFFEDLLKRRQREIETSEYFWICGKDPGYGFFLCSGPYPIADFF